MDSVSACVIFPCTIKSRKRFFLVSAHLGSPEKKSRRMVVCVAVLLVPCIAAVNVLEVLMSALLGLSN